MQFTKEELTLENYRNSSTAITARGKAKGKDRLFQLRTDQVMLIPILTGQNMLLVSDTGGGKTQFLKDVSRLYFGGNIEEQGHANWMIGRKDMSVDDLFCTWEKEQQRYVVREDRVRALVNIVDEMNRAPPIVQNDCFDLAEGERAINGQDRALGRDGYNLFMTAVNLNRINGDFEGTSAIDRALLSRARVNMDLDFYGITESDEAAIISRGKSRLALAPRRDLTEKILAAHNEITAKAGEAEPTLDFYLMLLSTALRHCETDELKRKRRNWPQECGPCRLYEKGVCYQVKQFEPRTTQSIKKFVYGMEYLLSVVEDAEVHLDPLDAAFEAAKFTAYHGNLNPSELLSRHKGDDQHMMNTVLGKIKAETQKVQAYLDYSLAEAQRGNVHTSYLQLNNQTLQKGGEIIADTQEMHEGLDAQSIAYTSVNPFTALSEIGLGTSWIEAYFKTLAR